MIPHFQNHADTCCDDDGYVSTAHLREAPMAVDVPTLPDTDQDGRAMCAIAAGAIIGGAIVVALHVWGWLL